MCGNAPNEARRIRVRGRVQGVWFRDSTRREALQLGITGHAINLANGDVEVLACGPAEALDSLCAWLREGPPLAHVSGCEVSPAEFQDISGFTIG